MGEVSNHTPRPPCGWSATTQTIHAYYPIVNDSQTPEMLKVRAADIVRGRAKVSPMDYDKLGSSDLERLLEDRETRVVFLVRHRQADAEGKNDAEKDKTRPLTELGKQQAKALVRSLLSFRFASTIVLASDATRTWETASLIATYLHTDNTVFISEDKLYRCRMSDFFSKLNGKEDSRHCFMVANNQSLVQLALDVEGKEQDFIPGDGYLVLAAKASSWEDFYQKMLQHCYVFEWTPPLEALNGDAKRQEDRGLRGTILYDTRVIFRDTG